MRILPCLLVVVGTTCCLAQQTNYRHAAGLEFPNVGYNMPTGIFLQYDYMFNHSTRGFWDAGASVGGFGFAPEWNAFSVRTNVSYNFHFSKKDRFIETGIGGSYVDQYYQSYEPPQSYEYYVGPQVGYRRIGAKGFQFRAYVGVYTGTHTFFSGGVGVGWAFRKLD